MKKNPPPRKHHYLPQFYLRRFSISGDGLFQISKSDGRIIPVKIKDTAAIRDFHEMDGDDISDKYALEVELAKVEGELAPYLTDILSGGFHHRPTQMYVIQLLSMLRMRVPALRDFLRASMSDVVHARLRMLESEGKFPSSTGLDDVLQADQVRIEIMNWALMEKMFGMAASENVLRLFYDMQPTLLHAPMGSEPVRIFV